MLEQRIYFFRQLAVVLQSGLPLLRGLELLSSRQDTELSALCYRLRQSLARGQSLAQAMETDKFFPTLACSLVRAGEESGELAAILEQLAAYYERQAKLKSFLLKTMLYPVFVLGLSIALFILFLVVVLPALADIYASMQIQPQGILLFLLKLKEHVFIILLLMVWTIILGGLYARKIFTWLLVHSLLRKFYILLQEIRFCKLLALLLESGMGIVQAVQLISSTVEIRLQKAQWLLWAERLQRGADLAECVGDEFSSLTVDLVRVGSVTGTLPEMLRQAAIINEEKLLQKLETFKEILGPSLLILVALFIGMILYAVIGPLFEMISMLPE